MQILPNVHLIPNIVANPYLILDPDGLTLIDAGLPGSHRKILRYISGLGLTPSDLKRILITHADFDHVGGLAALKKATAAAVYASPLEAAAILAGHASRPLKPRNALIKMLYALMAGLFKPASVRVDQLLSDGQLLPILGGLQVLETPGHTPGHLSFYSPSAGVLFCGDSLVSTESGLRGSTGANNWDQASSDASVRRQAALLAPGPQGQVAPRILCSGHGPVVLDAASKFPQI